MTRHSFRFASVAVALAVFLGLAAFGPPLLASREVSMKGRQAPEFPANSQWWNSEPLTTADLQGKVVLVQFWTYTCINWLRTLPYVQAWSDTYKDKGLVVVGVHAPEFSFEHDKGNVEAAIKQFAITYPVVQDNPFRIWRAYNNNYWPAAFLVDRSGKIVATQIGEGNYAGMERAIAQLVGAAPPGAAQGDPDLSAIGTPEIYVGAGRNGGAIVRSQTVQVGERNYAAPASVPLNRFALAGTWKLSQENATLSVDGGEIVLRFRAPKINVVAGSASPQTLAVTVDGTAQPSVTIDRSRLYTLYSGTAGEHELRLTIPKAGLAVFSFTFG